MTPEELHELRLRQEAQGWTDGTLLNLALRFIGDSGLAEEFAGFLGDVAAEENSEEGVG